MRNMSKSELISHVSARSGLSQHAVREVFEGLTEVVGDAVSEGVDVTLPRIGKVVVRDTAERQVRNPRTGETFTKPPGRSVRITPNKALKDKASNGSG